MIRVFPSFLFIIQLLAVHSIGAGFVHGTVFHIGDGGTAVPFQRNRAFGIIIVLHGIFIQGADRSLDGIDVIRILLDLGIQGAQVGGNAGILLDVFPVLIQGTNLVVDGLIRVFPGFLFIIQLIPCYSICRTFRYAAISKIGDFAAADIHIAAADGGGTIRAEGDCGSLAPFRCLTFDGRNVFQILGQLDLQFAVVAVDTDVPVCQLRAVRTADDIQLVVQLLSNNSSVIAFELQAVIQSGNGMGVTVLLTIDDPGNSILAVLAVNTGSSGFRSDDGRGEAIFAVLSFRANKSDGTSLAVFANGNIRQAAVEGIINCVAGDQLAIIVFHFTGTNSTAPGIFIFLNIICRSSLPIRILQIGTDVGSIHVGFQSQTRICLRLCVLQSLVDRTAGNYIAISFFDFTICADIHLIRIDTVDIPLRYGRMAAIHHIDGTLGQILDYCLTFFRNIGKILQVGNIGGIRPHMGIQSRQVLACRFICRNVI